MAFLSVRPHRGKVSGKAPCVERAPLPRPDLLRRAFPQKPSARPQAGSGCPDRSWSAGYLPPALEETFDVTLSDYETPIRTIAGGLAMTGLAQALRLLLEINRRP
jgi:hypothetical protein